MSLVTVGTPPACVAIYEPPAAGVMFGTDRLLGVPFPLVVESQAGDQYFHAYEHDGRVVWDVFLWHPDLSCPMYEIRASRPAVDGASEATGRSVVYSDDFGFELSISDQMIEVSNGRITALCGPHGIEVGSIRTGGNSIEGYFAGYRLGLDGSVAVAVNTKPAGMLLVPIWAEERDTAAEV